MKTGVVGIKGVWAMALLGAVGLASACGSDDDVSPPNGTGGSAGTAGKAGGSGAGTAGKAGSSGGGTGGSTAGTGGKAGSGGMAGEATSGSGGSTNGEAGMNEQGGAGQSSSAGGTSGRGGRGGRGGASGRGGSTSAGGTSGSGGTAGHAGNFGSGGTAGPGGEGGLGGEGGESGASPQGGASGESGAAGAGGAGQATLNLFFSEYVEATGTNPRALEIINKSGGTESLSSCNVNIFSNGATTPTTTVSLAGSVADGDVFVVCSAAIGTQCDQVSASLTFDGNDAIVLRCGSTRLDSIGEVANNPGTEWGDATIGTQNQTLRRLCNVTSGDRNPNDAFTPSTQWISISGNSTVGLGNPACG